MKEAYESVYHELESNHFWFKARRNYILQLLKNTNKDAMVLDVGCSSGLLIEDLISAGFNPNNIYGIDISQKAISNAKAKNLQSVFVMDAKKIDLDKKFDILIASDCLEHIDDDIEALHNWYSLLKYNGTLMVFVPAFMFLWSEHDVANLHFRRYTKNMLKERIMKAGFQIQNTGYWNFTLFFPVLFFRFLKKILNNKKSTETGDLESVPKINGLLLFLMNVENKILKLINFPFGISVFCIGRKK